MGKLSRALSGMLVVMALAACKDALTVDNSNNPDRSRFLARPSDVETLIKGAYKSVYGGTYGVDGLAPSARTMSWENASNLNNWGLGPRSAIPRSPIDNNRGNTFLTENQQDWTRISNGLRAAADGLNMVLAFKATGVTGPYFTTLAQDARAIAFGWFGLGIAMGYLAADYDSATIVDPRAPMIDPAQPILPQVSPLSSYAPVNVAALAALDSALAWTTTARNMTGGYGTGTMFDNTWINGMTFTADQFAQLLRSYKAYFRANNARTPTERAAVDWASVRDDAAAGITADITVTTTGTAGWVNVGNQWWLYQQWGQLHQLVGGMADSSCVNASNALVACSATGATRQYDNWLAASEANKVQFLIRTPDRRFPQGDTRTLQIANSPAAPAGRLYFRNRTSADPDAAPWSSYYDWYRMLPWYTGGRVTAFPVFPKAMNDLLRAEALIRLGDIPGAAALIDLTRVASGLPALTGVVTSASQAVPGGNACVPHVPTLTGTTWSAPCGTIMEAMKWEYRMETMFVSYISQWYSGRGWGDLPEGTAIHWPVPYQEMDTRLHPFYSLAGVGRPGGSVGKGNYGY